MEPTYVLGAIVLGFVILSLGVHEAAHAWVASLCGDDTAKNEGRLTLNPIPHIDPFMTVIVPVVLFYLIGMPFGGARPVPVVQRNLRKPMRDMMLVALAGPASNVVLAVIFLLVLKALVFWGGMDSSALAPKAMYFSMYMNLLLAIFNMIPVPPLDGSRVMAFFLPQGLRETYVSLERFGLLLVVGLMYFGFFTTVLDPTIGRITRLPDGDIVIGVINERGRLDTSFPPLIRWLHVNTGGKW